MKSMSDRVETVHAHKIDADRIIEEYRQKGYALKERTKPTVIAQTGFEKLVFVPIEDMPPTQPEPLGESRKRRWFLR